MKLVDRDAWKFESDAECVNSVDQIKCNLKVNGEPEQTNAICFGSSYDVDSGTPLSTTVTDEALQAKAGSVADKLGIPLEELRKQWFEVELPAIMGQYAPSSRDGWWFNHNAIGVAIQDLGIITTLDFIQRFPGMVWAYMNLRKRLPKEEPWNLFQIVHSIPLVHGNNHEPGGVKANADLNKLESYSLFYGDWYVHALARGSGNWQEWSSKGQGLSKLTPTYKIALDRVTSVLNREFLGELYEGKYADPNATWDEWAEWSVNYIKTGEI